MKKILFIIHEASETGAPLVVNNLLETSYSKNYKCYVLSIYGGAIEVKLKNNAEVSILHEKFYSNSVYNKLVKKIFKPRNSHLKKLDSGFFDLVYVNSLATLMRLPSLDFLSKNKTILHIHEGPLLIDDLGVGLIIHAKIKLFSKLIFVSDFVKNTIVSRYGIDIPNSEVIPPVIRNIEEGSKSLNRLKIPEKSFVICSSGSMNYIKGVDVFFQIAKSVIEKANMERPIYFVWVGMNGNAEIRNNLFNDLKKTGIEDYVKIVPNTTTILDYFRESNVFLLTSREESFSMVAMENIYLGNPVVCFDKGNGTTEFITNENGAVVPYLDIQAAAAAILEMYNDPEVLQQKSEAAKKMSISFSKNKAVKRIFNVIDEVINVRK